MRQAASAKCLLIMVLFACGRVPGKEVVMGQAVENACSLCQQRWMNPVEP